MNKRQLLDCAESSVTSKKLKPVPSVSINPDYLRDEYKNQLSTCWRNGQELQDVTAGSELLTTPFPCCILPNFIQDNDGFLDSLKDEILRLKYYEKDNDLYQFHQSNDLKSSKSSSITAFRSLFLTQCRNWMQNVTGIELDDSVDLTASKYEYTDVLLCHDDELEKRRIAFIYYLVPPWDDSDGGTLDLFNTDDKGRPLNIVRSIKPVWNNFVFFEVNLVSFHQVSEILCTGKTRLSINGWFHGTPIGRPAPTHEAPLQYWSPMPMELDVLATWVKPVYLNIGIQSQVRSQFEKSSQISLPDFIVDEKYQALCDELRSTECTWEKRGPPNKRNILEAVPSSLPTTVRECLNFLRSEPFCLLLAHLTGLDLVKDFQHHFPQLVTRYTEKGMSSDEPIELLSSDEEEGNKEKASKQSSSQPPKNNGDLEKHATIKMVSTKKGTEGQDTTAADPECTSVCHATVIEVSAGCYTLAHDQTPQPEADFTLDVMLFADSKDWCSEYGGAITYISKGDDQELLTIMADRPNLLALAYVETDTMKFIKYANHRARHHGDASYKMFSVTYCEEEPDEESSQ